MVVTVMSMIVALALGVGVHMVPGFEAIEVVPVDYFALFFVATFSLSLLPWIAMLFLQQGAEVQPISVAALRSNLADWKLFAYSAAIAGVSLLGMIVAYQPWVPQIWSCIASVLCAGVLIDLLRMAYCRFQFRRTPEGLAEWFIQVMMESAKSGDEKWHDISFEVPFGLMMVYMRNGAYGSLRLFCSRIVEMSDLWLGSIARLVMFKVPGEFEENTLDRYSRAEEMAAKRIAWVIQESCALGSLPGLEETTRLTGKLFLTFHSHHESLGSVLLTTLSEASQKDLGNIGLWDLEREVISTYADVVISLIERCIHRKASDTASILMVLGMLENKVKEIVRSEKTIRPALLMRPFVHIERMLGNNGFRSFPGREEVVADLRRSMAQFSVLTGIAAPLSEGAVDVTDTEASFGEDLPFVPHRRKE